MKGILKKLLVVGVGSTLLGGILFLVGCAGNGFDFTTFSSIQIKQEEYVESAGQNFTELSLSFETADFQVRFDENAEKVSVSYPQRQNRKGENLSNIQIVEKESGLHVTETQQPHFTVFNFSNSQVILTLPKARVYNLSIHTDTGDIAFYGNGSFTSLSLEVSTGDVSLASAVVETTLSVQATTGDLTLNDATANDIFVKASTGDVTLFGVSTTGKLEVETSTGDISLSNAAADSLSVKTTTGDVKLQTAAIVDDLTVKTDTGRVTLLGDVTASSISLVTDTGDIKANEALLDGTNISITTDTGDVNATLVASKHDYATTVDTDTGSKNITSNLENILDGLLSPTRTLKVKTDTGDIKIYFSAEN